MHAAGSEGKTARGRGGQLFTELKGELTLEHVEGLVERVVVQRRALPACGHSVLDQGDRAAGLLASQEHGGFEWCARGHRFAAFGSWSDFVCKGVSGSHSSTIRASAASGAATRNTACTAWIDVGGLRGEHCSQHRRPDGSTERAEEARGGGGYAELAPLDAVLNGHHQHLGDHAEAEAEQGQADAGGHL